MYSIRRCTRIVKSLQIRTPRRLLTDSPTVIKLTHPATGSDVYVVGTVHISKGSADEVRQVINKVNPDTIMVELDPVRARSLWLRLEPKAHTDPVEYAHNWPRPAADAVSVKRVRLVKARAPTSGQSLAVRFLGGYFSLLYRAFELVGFKAGREFAVAIDEAMHRNARLVFGDAAQQSTFENIQKNVSLRDLVGVFVFPQAVFFPAIYGVLKDLVTRGPKYLRYSLPREWSYCLSVITPGFYRGLVADRDQTLCESLFFRCPGQTVVGVVGRGHLAGISQHWEALSRCHGYYARASEPHQAAKAGLTPLFVHDSQLAAARINTAQHPTEQLVPRLLDSDSASAAADRPAWPRKRPNAGDESDFKFASRAAPPSIRELNKRAEKLSERLRNLNREELAFTVAAALRQIRARVPEAFAAESAGPADAKPSARKRSHAQE
eukprot:TRINITY_DN27485_c0_g1_i1.p1 TRINITY_DN27485_c0_g1~~TRINITY_DN27485_c0_g1_i1.p1  ORF type:complete len:437 (+),score=83.48 TRINITY_DN27485_c0_g1_i1:17-1327(+)